MQQLSSFTSGEVSTVGGLGLARGGGGGLSGHSLADPAVMGRHGGGGSDLAPNGRGVNYGGQLPVDAVSRPGPETGSLPPDASSTLYVEGLPSDSTRREVARILFILMQCLGIFILLFIYFLVSLILVQLFIFLNLTLDIFRPFVGYREVRLVSKESKHVSLMFVTDACFSSFGYLVVKSCSVHFMLKCLFIAAWWRSSLPLFCGLCKSSLCSNRYECLARYHL